MKNLDIKRIEKPILIFIISLTLFSGIDFLFNYFRLFSGSIWTFLKIVDVLALGYSCYYLFKDFEFENQYFKVIFYIFYAYQFIIIIRGVSLSYDEIKSFIGSDFIFWPFLIPLFIFFDKKVETIIQVIKCMYYLGIFFLITCIIYPIIIFYRPTAELFVHTFAFGCGFLIINANYLSKKKWLISLLVVLITLIAMVYLARRNVIVTFTGFILAAIYLYFKNSSFGKLVKIFPVVCIICLLPFFFLDKLPASLTKSLNERITEDTRSEVFDAYFLGMRDSELFGKGLNGTYYCPFEETILDDGGTFSAVQFRNVIENGYLQLMLNGGYIHIALVVLLLFPASMLGIFKSSNSLSRACGILILLWLIDMSIYGMPRLVLEYVFVWICVGICYKKSFREIPEEEIYAAFEKFKLL